MNRKVKRSISRIYFFRKSVKHLIFENEISIQYIDKNIYLQYWIQIHLFTFTCFNVERAAYRCIHMYIVQYLYMITKIKIIVSRYFRGLQIIFMDRAKASSIVADCLINFVIDVVYAMEFS